MMRGNNMCILMLPIILLVACKFFRNFGARKEASSFLDTDNKISSSRIATSLGKQEENASDATIGKAKKNKSIPKMLAYGPLTVISKEKQEAQDKLIKEGNKKFIDFLAKLKHINGIRFY
ncbi:hypothetical protein [Borreliella turdi]|uniref:hypothetical protein n=1 Tax=Borreliella turdi TaxID=57863 RepID=UPI001245AAF8|nr:hypothetical protein [Borreliella turdi]